MPTTSNLVPRSPLHVCYQGNMSTPWPIIDKDDKVQRLNNSVDLQIVVGSTRDFLQDSLLENLPPSKGGDSDPWFGRQRRHRPMGAPVLPGVAAVPYRRPSSKIDSRALNLRGSGAMFGSYVQWSVDVCGMQAAGN